MLVDPDGADLGVVTLAAADGTVLGIGTAALGSAQAPVSGATFVNDALVVARGQTLARASCTCRPPRCARA
ncbi:MAG: hypothetical protein U1F43_34315 [Myxococcota bacterium]